MKGDQQIGHHSESIMCTQHPEELLKYLPLNEHTIIPYGYDEEEEYWESPAENLEKYLRRAKKSNPTLRAYFGDSCDMCSGTDVTISEVSGRGLPPKGWVKKPGDNKKYSWPGNWRKVTCNNCGHTMQTLIRQ